MSVLRSKIERILSSIGFFVLLLSLSQLSWGSGYTIEWDNFNNGIQPESSDVYTVKSSLGQSITGDMQGGGYVLTGGFWAGFTYFLAGDVTNDGVVDLGDVVYLINYLFRGGSPPQIWATGDLNCDGVIDVGDVVFLINYLYRDGPAPPLCDPKN